MRRKQVNKRRITGTKAYSPMKKAKAIRAWVVLSNVLDVERFVIELLLAVIVANDSATAATPIPYDMTVRRPDRNTHRIVPTDLGAAVYVDENSLYTTTAGRKTARDKGARILW